MGKKEVATSPCSKGIYLKRYSLFKELKIYLSSLIMDNCYAYPVVYTDGLVSYLYEDTIGRTPYGIEIYNEIILLNDAEKKLTTTEAQSYCKNIRFAELRGTCPAIETLWFISKHYTKINDLISKLGGTPLKSGLYCSRKKVFYTDDGVTSESNPKAKSGYLTLSMDTKDSPPIVPIDLNKTRVFVRPALKL